MPSRLPVPDDLGQRRFQNRAQTVTPQFDFSGQQRLAATAQNVAENINDRLDAVSLQKAKLHFQKLKLEADNAFNEDQDFETYETRYNDMLSKAVDESSEMVRGQQARELFKEQVDLYRLEGLEAMGQKAYQKETEAGVAALNDSLTIGRENYLRATSPQDRAFARETIMSAIDQAKDFGYIDAVQAQKVRQDAAVDMAIASVEIEPPEKQVALLKENKGLIDLIPLDTRMKMIESAQAQALNDQALVIADEISSQGGSITERTAEVKKIKDADLRNLVQRQVEHDYSIEKSARLQREAENYDDARKALNAGQSISEWVQQNPKQWEGMSGDQQKSLMSSTKRTTDRQAYVTFTELAAEDMREAKDFLYQNAAKFDDSTFKTLVNKVNQPEEMEGFLTRSQRLGGKLNDLGIKKDSDKYYQALEALDKDYMRFVSQNDRKPNDSELQKMVNGVFEITVDGFFSDEYAFELTPEQRAARADTKEAQRKAAKFEQILKQVQAEKQVSDVPVVMSEEEIQLYYQNAERMGLLDE